MAKHRLRRWLQFGILDLMILTSVVAVVAVLCRPVQMRTSSVVPYLVGSWRIGEQTMTFFPDRTYAGGIPRPSGWDGLRRAKLASPLVAFMGPSWTIRPS